MVALYVIEKKIRILHFHQVGLYKHIGSNIVTVYLLSTRSKITDWLFLFCLKTSLIGHFAVMGRAEDLPV